MRVLYDLGKMYDAEPSVLTAVGEYFSNVSVARMAINRMLLSFLRSVSGDVLDIGGYSDLQPYVQSGKHVVIDIVQSPRNNVTADARNLPFCCESLGGVLCISVLEHCTAPEEILDEITRCLRPGGKAFISVPWLFESHMEPKDYWRFSNSLLEEWFERRRLTIEQLSPVNGYPGLLAHYMQKRASTRLSLGITAFLLHWMQADDWNFRWTTQLNCVVRKESGGAAVSKERWVGLRS